MPLQRVSAPRAMAFTHPAWESMHLMGRPRRHILNLSSRHLLPRSNARQAPEFVVGWIAGTPACAGAGKPRNDMDRRILARIRYPRRLV